MNIDWGINWAPTIVTIAVTIGVTFLADWLRNKRAKSKSPSEETEATYQKRGNQESSTRRFRGVKTWSRREYELKANGGQRLSEETINFESQEGSSIVSAKEIAKELQDIWKQPETKNNEENI